MGDSDSCMALPNICWTHSAKGFACIHGIDGRQQGKCPKKHLGWHCVSDDDKEKVKDWIKEHDTLVTFLKS